jgi:hypothetical protein
VRKVLLAVMLMGAAFAGGAVVNGPGLHWLREKVFTRLDDGGETPSVETAPQVADAGIPSAPVPTLASASAPPPAAASSAQPTPEPAQPAAAASARRPVALASLTETPTPVAALPPLEAPADAEAPVPAVKDPGAPEAPAAPGAQDAPTPQPSPAPALAAAAGPWADAPDSAPASAIPPRDHARPVEADPAVATAAAAPGDWPALRRQMRALGVARYGFEGEPAGRVRFHCVIPLAGRRAVGQQFEGEGDDEFQAAQVALRRVTLWQATENR